LRDVFYPILKFKDEKQTFAKVEGPTFSFLWPTRRLSSPIRSAGAAAARRRFFKPKEEKNAG